MSSNYEDEDNENTRRNLAFRKRMRGDRSVAATVIIRTLQIAVGFAIGAVVLGILIGWLTGIPVI